MTTHRYRSALYVPADHDRAMAKSASLDADLLIYDLEDGVAPERKDYARQQAVAILETVSKKQRIIRINHCHTSAYTQDIHMVVNSHADGVMLSKVNSAEEIDDAANSCAKRNRADLPIWCNVETPLGVVNIKEIAKHPSVVGVVIGTNDLANDLRITRTANRAALLHSLQRIQVTCRAYGKIVLDGTFIDFNDEAGLKAEAQQGRMLGFDGKTLVHPKQIAIANAAFSPTEDEMREAGQIVTAYEKAMQEGKAVTLLNGRMIERLHYDRARELLVRPS